MAGAIVKVSAAGIPVAGLGGTGIAYQTTKQSMLDVLEEDEVIVEKSDPAWENIFNAFKGKQDSSFKTKEFKDFYTEAKKTNSSLKKEDLHKKCSDQVNVNYKTIFSGAKEDLLGDIKTACLITIGGAMGANNYGTEEGNLESDNLKGYSGSDELEEKLKDAKKDLNGSENGKLTAAKKTHSDWCKDKENKKYLGKDDSNYKIFAAICKKKTTTGAGG